MGQLIRLKNELAIVTRRAEKLISQLSEKEEKLIQLGWSMTDKEKEKQDIDERLHRKIQSVSKF